MKTTNVKIDEDVYINLKDYCKKNNYKMRELVNLLLKKGLRDRYELDKVLHS